MSGKIMTVLGEVDSGDLGVTLVHEHLLLDLTSYFKTPEDPERRRIARQKLELSNLGIVLRDPFAIVDNLVMDDVGTAARELAEVKRAGGRTVVDVTCSGIGRDVEALRRIASKTGLNIVTASGYYIAASHPAKIRGKSVEEIADLFIDEVRNGIDGTGIRPGVIGEIGASQPITEDELKVFRAAARAQRATGLALYVHVYFHDHKWHALEYLDILEAENAIPEKVVMCHMDGHLDIDYHRAVAKRGAYVAFDTFGKEYTRTNKNYEMPKDSARVRGVLELAEAGYVDRILLSNDTCFKMNLRSYGGWGYDHLLTNIVPMFHNQGAGPDMMQKLLVENPKTLLSVDR